MDNQMKKYSINNLLNPQNNIKRKSTEMKNEINKIKENSNSAMNNIKMALKEKASDKILYARICSVDEETDSNRQKNNYELEYRVERFMDINSQISDYPDMPKAENLKEKNDGINF